MYDVNFFPPARYEPKRENPNGFRQATGKASDAGVKLWRDHYEALLAEGDEYRRLQQLSAGEKWQLSLCRKIGHWLITAGSRLERASRPLPVPSASR
jgi:hypothetical protein